MISRPVAVAVLAAGCLTAAVAGSYVAGRQSVASQVVVEPAPVPGTPAAPASQPVSETEAVVQPQPAPVMTEPEPAPIEVPAPRTRPYAPVARRTETVVGRSSAPNRPRTAPAVERPVEQPRAPAPVQAEPVEPPEAEVRRYEPAAATPATRREDLVIPASSVIGLEIETSLSSETARVEDRVDARVTRDVYADGRVAVPAGSRMIGAVTMVDRGGKVKERARLGVRFHTLVLGDGRQVDLRTDTIYREGDSVAAESSKKIGGAAIGGAVLGAIMGGGKGALLGGASGAAAGTAVVMAGGRNPATLPSGTVVTARVSGPVPVDVERR